MKDQIYAHFDLALKFCLSQACAQGSATKFSTKALYLLTLVGWDIFDQFNSSPIGVTGSISANFAMTWLIVAPSSGKILKDGLLQNWGQILS